MQNKERKIQNLISELGVLIYQLNDLEEYEKHALGNILLEQGHDELRNVSISLMECHVIDCIERNEMFNTTAIAKKLNITKGGISKIATRLIKKNLIEAYRLTDNQKEIYYRLKPLGRTVFELHETLHKEAEEVFKKIFSAYTQGELEFASRFLADITAAIRTTTGFKKNDIFAQVEYAITKATDCPGDD
ncbi:MarR family transcriptional regulator|uniref:DNA-binding transcriptional regulator, MarR family n=1 Tax=Dendrosporobacter quercicolus TaxID=146817 RepID=A0A1G9NP66_9FIRM|nr:MarR family transcriptional regulator [Dendrosporobacter quercicolus]NSL47403.1 MarR family transcriptional regulator [Dendrosporobacter quercicolus DSM 1736]SDL88189.1 DNA-binding transcriptional regulator, MarR family [Dendrosporobacter quercicolus]